MAAPTLRMAGVGGGLRFASAATATGSHDARPFRSAGGGATMKAIVTTGHGGFEKLVYRDVAVPVPSPGEVLVQVLAAGVNNTEINTRVGWYEIRHRRDGERGERRREAGLRQVRRRLERGAAVSLHSGHRLLRPDRGSRVRRRHGQYRLARSGARVHARRGLRLDGKRVDGLRFRRRLRAVRQGPGRRGLPGQLRLERCRARVNSLRLRHRREHAASRGLGTGRACAGNRRLGRGRLGRRAARQPPWRRVTAIAARAKMEQVRAIGCDRVIDRNDDVAACLGEKSVDVVVDNVAGPGFAGMLQVLKRGGRYASSGAIGGPIGRARHAHLLSERSHAHRHHRLGQPVFPNLIGYIERGEITPLVAKTFPLEQIADAQREFLEKKHVGNFVLVPPQTA